MADAFTLVIKVEAARRFVDKQGWSGALIVRGFLDQILREVTMGAPLPTIRDHVIEMRGSAGWASTGSRHAVWNWFDRWSFDLADYLSSEEEQLTIRELSARFHADLETSR